jgi:hypothetical protein
LALKFSANGVGFSIDFDIAMRIHFSDEGDPSLCERGAQMSPGILIGMEIKVLRQMSEGLPETVAKDSRESCTMVFLREPAMGFFIVVIPQEAFAGFPQSSQGRAFMPVQDSFFPETIKTFHRGISSRFSLGNENQVGPHKQIEANHLGKAVRIASSPCGGHLIVNLGDLGNPPSLARFLPGVCTTRAFVYR